MAISPIERRRRNSGVYSLPALLDTRLWNRVRAVEQEDCDLFVSLLADIRGAVNALGWLLPLDLSRRNLDAMALSSIAVLDQKHIPAQHDRYPMKRIAMPRHGFAGCETETTNHGGSMMKEDFVRHNYASELECCDIRKSAWKLKNLSGLAPEANALVALAFRNGPIGEHPRG
jgi:hypothetical protein